MECLVVVVVRGVGAVEAVLALAELGAAEPRVEALAVLLLALRLPAIAVFSIGSIHRREGEAVLVARQLLGLLHRLRLFVAVRAVAAVALVRAHAPRREALAVHFEAARLLAVAAGALLGDRRGGGRLEGLADADVRARADLHVGAADGLLLFVGLLLGVVDVVVDFEPFLLLGLFLGGLGPLVELQVVPGGHLVELAERGQLADGVDVFEREGLVLVEHGVFELPQVEEAGLDADRGGPGHFSLRFD